MKKQVLCTICVATLLLSGLSAAFPARVGASPGCFTYDLNDWERTHLSSGTGGTEPREAGEMYGYWEDTPELVDPKMLEMVNEWAKDAARKLGIDPADIQDESNKKRVYGRFVNDALYQVKMRAENEEDGVDSEDGYAHTCIQTAVFDVENRRQLSLSDLFYDGVNYIDYINQYIASTPSNTAIHYNTETQMPRAGKAPFTGLPFDYPYFTMYLDYLRIELDDHNPFWRQDEYAYESAVFVPLAHWVSPWGECTMRTHYIETEMTNGMRFLSPVLRIDEGRYPEAEAAINAMLAEMSEREMREAEEIETNEKKWVQPSAWSVREWGCVNLNLMCNFDGFEDSERTLAFAVFNLHTGEVLEPAATLERFREAPEVTYSKRSQDLNGAMLPLSGYLPSASTEITDMYPIAQEGGRVVVVLQDAGAMIVMAIPMRLLDAEKPPYLAQ